LRHCVHESPDTSRHPRCRRPGARHQQRHFRRDNPRPARRRARSSASVTASNGSCTATSTHDAADHRIRQPHSLPRRLAHRHLARESHHDPRTSRTSSSRCCG
jgi:hypothetical protein